MHNENIQVVGKRMLVEKERLDVGGLNLTPTQEGTGQKNIGIIIGVGSIGLFNRLVRFKVGTKIIFKKFFISNDEMDNSAVFVDIDSIIGIIK